MQQNSSKSNEGEISWRKLQTNNGQVEAEEAKVYEAKIDNDAIQEALPENVRGNIKELRIVIDQLHLNFIQAGELIPKYPASRVLLMQPLMRDTRLATVFRTLANERKRRKIGLGV